MASKVGYIPALLKEADDPTPQTIDLLKEAIKKYEDGNLYFKLGMLLLKEIETCEEVFPYFEKGNDLNHLPSQIQLGLILSPFTKILPKRKNPKRSLQIFEQIISMNLENPIALHQVAQFYHHGKCVKRNLEKAQDYLKRAQRIDSKIEDLPPIPPPNWKKRILISVGISSAIFLVVFILYLIFRSIE
jgi:TPR repeat protein